MRWLFILLYSVMCSAQTTTPTPPDVSDPNNVQYVLSQVQTFAFSTDKQLHMAGCFMISSMTTSYVYNRTADKRKAILIGFSAGMAAGIIKEVVDLRYGHSDWNDLLADGIGSSLGAVSITFTF